MRKMVATIATGIIIVGSGATSVAAEEYKVKSGDSLWNIANEYNTTVDELVQLNELKNTTIHPEQKIQVTEVQEETYKVKKGDTLSKIASSFDTNVASVKEWNNLNSDLIVVGQSLSVQPGVKVAKQSQVAEAPKAETAKEAPKAEQSAPAKEVKAEQQPAKEEARQVSKAKEEPKQETKATGKQISVEATAYTADCAGCSGVTATGINLNNDRNAKVIAVDPSVIPLGSKVHVPGYGTAIAGDKGSAIKGNKIDVHVPTKSEATNWGRKNVTITVIE